MLTLEGAHGVRFNGLDLDKIELAGRATIVYGQNGSGKTRFVQALQALRELVAGTVEPSRAAHDQQGLQIRIDTVDDVGAAISYSVRTGTGPALPVEAEQATYRANPRREPVSVLETTNGSGYTAGASGTAEERAKRPLKMAAPGLCALRAMGNLSGHIELSTLSSWISGWHIDADIERRAATACPRVFDPVVSEEGDSIPAVIQLMRAEEYEDAGAYERIRDGVRDLTDDAIRELNCHLGPDGYVGLVCVLKNGVEARWNELSQGLRDAVRYETLLQTTPREKLLIADCPDTAMDYRISRRLVERTASVTENEPQVLLFTRNGNSKGGVPWRITRTLEPKAPGKAGGGTSQCR